MNKVRKEFKSYKEIKLIIDDIEISIQELKEKKANDEEINCLTLLKNQNERRIKRIINAMTILTDQERKIIEFTSINNNKYNALEERLHLSYSRIKQIEIRLRHLRKWKNIFKHL